MGVPHVVLDAYQLAAAEPLPGGLINATFLANSAGADSPSVVLQRLHSIFAAEVNIDIAAITEHLAAAGLETPRIVPTSDGSLWVEHDGAVWRALTFVPGETIDAVADPRVAEAAGELVGRFHAALADLDHTFAFARAGVHDTAAHLAKLDRLVDDAPDEPWVAGAVELARQILDAAASRPEWGELPERITHGDLKISNVRFASVEPPIARCLLDLDTLGTLTLAYELGDALRSWCNNAEDSGEPTVRVDVFAAALAGYRRGNPSCPTDELAAVPAGALTVSLELAARFCADVFEDSYFGWDPARFPDRRSHNLVRARNQLALAGQFRSQFSALETAVEAACRAPINT